MRQFKTQQGFTLVELMMVLVMVGILASYAVLRTNDANNTLVQAYADRFAQHIKHVQMLAMTWGQGLTLTVAGSSYQVSCTTATSSPPCNSSPVIDPVSGQAFSVSMADGVTLIDSGNIIFDALGRPLQSGSLSSSASQWRVGNASTQVSVRVDPITGRVSQ